MSDWITERIAQLEAIKKRREEQTTHEGYPYMKKEQPQAQPWVGWSVPGTNISNKVRDEKGENERDKESGCRRRRFLHGLC